MCILFLPMVPLLPVLLLQRSPLLGRVPRHGPHDERLAPHRPRHGAPDAARGRGRGDGPRPRDDDGRGFRGAGRSPRRPRAHCSNLKDAVSTDTTGLNPAAAFDIRATITSRFATCVLYAFDSKKCFRNGRACCFRSSAGLGSDR